MDNNISNEKVEDITKKEEVVVSEKKVNDTSKKKGNNRVIALVICAVGLICLIIGVVMFLTEGDEKETSGNEEPGVVEDNNSNYSITVNDVKDFSEYENYNVDVTYDLASNGNEYTLNYNADVDMINSNIKATIVKADSNQYIYYDINNKMHYISDDEVAWEKNTNNKAGLPDYSSVISKVKEDSNVENRGNGQFYFETALIVSVTLYNSVPTTVTFDSNGFLKEITYDLSGMIDGMEKYIRTYKFNNVNQNGNVSIPNDVINNATETTNVEMLDF